MKKLYALFALLFLMGSAFAQVLVNETFETGNTVDQTPVGWICNDGGWKAGIAIPDDNTARGRQPHTGDWYMYSRYNTDVWIYKEINVTAGHYYHVSFWYATWRVGHFNLEVKAGASAEPSAMTVNVVPDLYIDNTEFLTASGVFQAPISGTYYVGFHSVADNGPWYLSVDDVVIEQTAQYYFNLEQLTPDTAVYFGESAYLRFLLDNKGEQSDIYQFVNTGNLPVEFYQNGAQVSQVSVPYNSSAEVIAKVDVPFDLTDGQELHATFDVTSAHSAPTRSADYKITALAPFNAFPLTEGFEEAAFPPAGWQNIATQGTRVFERKESNDWPACTPHEGSDAMAYYYCFTNAEGNKCSLVSPKMQLAPANNTVRYWIYRNFNNNINRPDRINVYYSPTADVADGTLLGTVHRNTMMEPVVGEVSDWYEYSYTFDSPEGYGFIIFEGVSGYGWNLCIDDITITSTNVDAEAPALISIQGTQQYADTEMNLQLRVYDASDMPSTLAATYSIGDVGGYELTFTRDRSNYNYSASIPGQPNHTEGSIVVTLVDELGNSTTTDPIAIHWDYQRPLLYETFEECAGMSLPDGWYTVGEQTWFDWSVYGETAYTDYYENSYYVIPHSGSRQAVLEWDSSEEPVAQDQMMVTPVVSITEPTVLTFWTWAQYGSADYDHFAVRVLDCSTGQWEDRWDAINLPSGQINAYQTPISINLDSYIGSNIRIGFRGYNSIGDILGWSWFIDDVKVVITDTIDSPGVGVVETLVDDVQLYPNPVKDQVHISSNNLIRQVVILTANGAMIENKRVDDYVLDYRLEGYAKGTYVIRLVTDEGVVNKKIVLL